MTGFIASNNIFRETFAGKETLRVLPQNSYISDALINYRILGLCNRQPAILFMVETYHKFSHIKCSFM